MTKDDFQKSATSRGSANTAGHQGQGAAVVKLQPDVIHTLAPRSPMPKSPFGHIMPTAVNLKVLRTLVTVTKDESEKESGQDEG